MNILKTGGVGFIKVNCVNQFLHGNPIT